MLLNEYKQEIVFKIIIIKNAPFRFLFIDIDASRKLDPGKKKGRTKQQTRQQKRGKMQNFH